MIRQRKKKQQQLPQAATMQMCQIFCHNVVTQLLVVTVLATMVVAVVVYSANFIAVKEMNAVFTITVVHGFSSKIIQQRHHRHRSHHHQSQLLWNSQRQQQSTQKEVVVPSLRINFNRNDIDSRTISAPINGDYGGSSKSTTTIDVEKDDVCLEEVVPDRALQQMTTTTTTAASPMAESQQPPPQKERTPKTKVVVVMNANARGVSSSTIQMAQQVFGMESVHVTKTIPDLVTTLQTVLFGNDDDNNINIDNDEAWCKESLMIVTMGGDGTLSTTIQIMCQLLWDQRNKAVAATTTAYQTAITLATTNNMDYTSMISQLPIIAYVPLGTGNAVGSVVGCVPPPANYNIYSNSQSTTTTTTTTTSNRIFRFIRQRIIHPMRCRSSSNSTAAKKESRALRRLRSTLVHIQDTIHRASTTTTPNNSVSPLPITELPMIEISATTLSSTTAMMNRSTDVCFFAGAGFDSLMLNDFKEVKEWSQRTGLFTRLLSSITGYCVTLIIKTLPKTVLRSRHIVNVQVTSNQLNNTYFVDHRRGDFAQPCRTPLLYNGTTGIIAGSTVPYYGGKMRLFPFARMSPDKLHLRIGRIHPLVGFLNIPKIFAGTYRDTSKTRFGVLDFIGSDFTIQVSSNTKNGTANSFPLQHSGESIGPISSFRLRVIDAPIRFLNLLPER